jgi:hypothetical protein
MSGSTKARALLIYKEQTKLLANWPDRASTASGAGSVSPVIGLIEPDGSRLDNATFALFIAAFLVLFSWSAVLHYAARRALKGLR